MLKDLFEATRQAVVVPLESVDDEKAIQRQQVVLGQIDLAMRALCLLRSIHADVEALRVDGGDRFAGSGDCEYGHEEVGVTMSWPNLAILADDVGKLLRDIDCDASEAAAPAGKERFTRMQFDAVLAGLRLLQTSLSNRLVLPDDGEIGDVLTNGGAHAGLTCDEIDALCVDLNTGQLDIDAPRVLVMVNGGVVEPVFDPGVDVEIFDFDNYKADPIRTGGVPRHFAHLAQAFDIPVEA